MHIYSGDDIEPELQASLLPESLLEELNFMGEDIWTFGGKDTKWPTSDYQPITSTSVSTILTSTTTSAITAATTTATSVTASLIESTSTSSTAAASTCVTTTAASAKAAEATIPATATPKTNQLRNPISETTGSSSKKYKKWSVGDPNSTESLYTLFPKDPSQPSLACVNLSALFKTDDTGVTSWTQNKYNDDPLALEKKSQVMVKLGNFLSIMTSFAVVLLCYFLTHIVTPLRMALVGRGRMRSTFPIAMKTTPHKPLSFLDQSGNKGNSEEEKWKKPLPSPSFSYYFHEWPATDDQSINSEADTELAWWHRNPSVDVIDFENESELTSSPTFSLDSCSISSTSTSSCCVSSDSSSSCSFSSDSSSSLSSLPSSSFISPIPSTSVCRVWSSELSIQNEEPPEPFLLLESLINGFYFTKKKESSLIKLLSSSRKPTPKYQQRVNIPWEDPNDGSRWNSPEAFSKLNPLAKEFEINSINSTVWGSAGEFQDSGTEELFAYEDDDSATYDELQSVVDEESSSPPSTPQHKKKKKKKKKKKSTAPRHTKWMTIFPDSGPLARKNVITSTESSEDSEHFDEIITKGSMESSNEKNIKRVEKRHLYPITVSGGPGLIPQPPNVGVDGLKKRPVLRYVWYNVVTCDSHNGLIHHQYLMQTDIVSSPYYCVRYPSPAPFYPATDPRVSEPIGIPYAFIPAAPVGYPESGVRAVPKLLAIDSQ